MGGSLGLYCRFIGVILAVHWGYIAGSLGLYRRFIGVILPVHRGYIPVHWGYIFETKIVAYGMLSDTVCTAPLGPITKNSGLRHVSTKPSAQRRSDQQAGAELCQTQALVTFQAVTELNVKVEYTNI